MAVNLQSPPPTEHALIFIGQTEGLLVFGDESSCESTAGIVCQGLHCGKVFCTFETVCILDPIDTEEANCTDGDIQLSNGGNVLEGRVEICYNRAWGTVCSRGFAETEANVICSQLDSDLGYAHSTAIPRHNAAFGEGTGPIFIDNIACTEGDVQFGECSVVGIRGFHECDHSQDAGVVCEGKRFEWYS